MVMSCYVAHMLCIALLLLYGYLLPFTQKTCSLFLSVGIVCMSCIVCLVCTQ